MSIPTCKEYCEEKTKLLNPELLVVSMTEPEKNSNVPSLDWGKQNEINAAETFMKQEGIHHLVISKSHPYIGGTINQSIHLNLLMTRNIYNQI